MGCTGCEYRKHLLNTLWPGLGNATESVIQYGLRKIMPSPISWSYGVTTVPSRFHTTLPRTLASLQAAGFDRPRIFVDGGESIPEYCQHLPITYRRDQIKTVGNWVLSLSELMIREPHADRYAIFQDDFVTCRNLKQYLSETPYPTDGYLNLYTFPENQKLAKGTGWYKSNQLGRGAVALVFSRQAAVTLLTSTHLINKPRCKKRGTSSVDGGIVESMKKAGWKEYVHNPSLVQHIGEVSSMGNKTHPLAPSFLGEEYDALELLRKPVPPEPPPIPQPGPQAASQPDLVLPVAEPQEPPMPKHQLGIVGHNGRSTKSLSSAAVSLLEADRWLGLSHFGGEPRPEGIASLETSGRLRDLKQFCAYTDTLLFFDTPFLPRLLEVAREANCRTVCVLTSERDLRPEAAGWYQHVDLFICPTPDFRDAFVSVGYNAVYYPWPTGYAPAYDEELREAVIGVADFPHLEDTAEIVDLGEDSEPEDETLLDGEEE